MVQNWVMVHGLRLLLSSAHLVELTCCLGSMPLNDLAFGMRAERLLLQDCRRNLLVESKLQRSQAPSPHLVQLGVSSYRS